MFSVVFTPSPPAATAVIGSSSVISLLLNNTVSPVRACLSIRLERFRGSQKEDERWASLVGLSAINVLIIIGVLPEMFIMTVHFR